MKSYRTIIETAKKVNDLFRDYDPFDFDPESCPAEEIAEMIIKKDRTVIDDLMDLAKNTSESEDYAFSNKALVLLHTVQRLYA